MKYTHTAPTIGQDVAILWTDPDRSMSHCRLEVGWRNAPGKPKRFTVNVSASVIAMLRVAFGRWQVEKWFERAKQEADFGAFEVRTYKSLIRHWLCSCMVMYFLAAQTQRLRGEKPRITLEQVPYVAKTLASKIRNRWPQEASTSKNCSRVC